jgi:uncharacterized protein (TIGR03086 family)
MTHQKDNSDQAILRRAHDELTCVVAALTDEERHLPSPCPAWSVDDVIHHLAAGAIMAVALLGGADSTAALAIRMTWIEGGFTLQRLRTALALERTAFDVAAPTDQVDHPVFPMSAVDLLGQRIIEYAVHIGDIRRPIDDHTPLDAVLAGRAWQLAAPLAPIAAQLGVFGDGPSGLLADDADHETLLADVTGRRSPASTSDTSDAVTR